MHTIIILLSDALQSFPVVGGMNMETGGCKKYYNKIDFIEIRMMQRW